MSDVATGARVLLDSVSEAGHRLTTMEVVMHRFVLAEFNTHRVFSRNSASSRAIPVAKRIEQVRNNPAMPVAFPAEQKGMGGHEDGLTYEQIIAAEQAWDFAAIQAANIATVMVDIGVHKSVVNRLLEPFLMHTVIVTATEWDGFWHQRCSPMAQPEIRVVAEAMKAAYDSSTPRELGHGEWHTPLIQPDEGAATWTQAIMDGADGLDGLNMGEAITELRKRVSAARIARTSYLTHGGVRDVREDLGLFDKLTRREGEQANDPIHWSPLEHVATPCPKSSLLGTYVRLDEVDAVDTYCTSIQVFDDHTHLGNFRGWDQFRHSFGGVVA